MAWPNFDVAEKHWHCGYVIGVVPANEVFGGSTSDASNWHCHPGAGASLWIDASNEWLGRIITNPMTLSYVRRCSDNDATKEDGILSFDFEGVKQ